MPGKDKKFLRKKNAVTYRLVPRSMLDPDADSSEHILVPVDELKHEKFNVKLPACALPPPVKQVLNQKKQIPAKGPQPFWDPDIDAALNTDFNYEDAESVLELEDDFIAKANGTVGEVQPSAEFDECDDDDDGTLFPGDDSFSGKQKTKHLQYSLTSTVPNCSEGTKIFNERFEKFCETYEDDQIGSLEFDAIEGHLNLINEPEADDVNYKKKLHPYEGSLDENLKLKTLYYCEVSEDEESDSEEEVTEQTPKYDAESIISTYSNKHNHPTLIKAEKKEKCVKIPSNPSKSVLTRSNLRKVDQEADIETVSESETMLTSCVRPKNETPEEKKQRKQAVKQLRKESRMLKKKNKLAFKEEKKRASSAALNASRNKVVPLLC